MAVLAQATAGGLAVSGDIPKYRLVKENGGKVDIAGAVGTKTYGVTTKDHKDGDLFQGHVLHLSEVVEIECGEAISGGDPVFTSGVSGDHGKLRGISNVTSSGTFQIVGFLGPGDAADGDIREIFVEPHAFTL